MKGPVHRCCRYCFAGSTKPGEDTAIIVTVYKESGLTVSEADKYITCARPREYREVAFDVNAVCQKNKLANRCIYLGG